MNDEDLNIIIDMVMKHITTNVPSSSLGIQIDVELGVDNIIDLRNELRSFIEKHINAAYQNGYDDGKESMYED